MQDIQVPKGKFLMTTEKLDINDSIFAFSHLWIKTIALQVEQLTVIALSVGEYDLPRNVKVYSLGKEKFLDKKEHKFFKNLKYTINFYKIIWVERNNYDYVFVHMNQQYVLMGAPIWKFFGKKIGLWYTHKAVTNSLKMAVKFVDVIFTAAEESMNVVTIKKRVMGHGIDTKTFLNPNRKKVFYGGPTSVEKVILTSIGRITQIKNLETLIRATQILKEKYNNGGKIFETRLIGPEVNEVDKKYREKLNKLVLELNLEKNILFLGGKKPKETKEELWIADIHVNLCPTGGLDKAVIESACSGVHSFVANQAFRKTYGDLASDYLFEHGNAENLAEKIENILNLPLERSQEKLDNIQKIMLDNFDVKKLINNILTFLKRS